MRIAVIGAGAAGAACAYMLKNAGHDVVVYEENDRIAQGGSSNRLGMFNPRISAFKDDRALFYEAAFYKAREVFALFGDIDMMRCGSLHLIADEKRRTKFEKACAHWGWGADKMRVVNAREASDIAGVEVRYDALYLPEAGCVSPVKLCGALLDGVEVRCGEKVRSLQIEDVDKVVLACARGVQDFDLGINLKLQTIRGQVTRVYASELSSKLKTNLCYGGYCTPRFGQEHVVGATFQRWLDHNDLLDEDDDRNLENLATYVPVLAEGLERSESRAGVRVAAQDVFPVIGQISEDVYISTAHGSHGLISSVMGAQLICEAIAGNVQSLPSAVVKALSPLRFS